MNPLNTLIEEYRNVDGVADIFGVILYTDEHPNIKKVLRDEDYWLSFHELTGKRFCVFSVKPKMGKFQIPSVTKGAIGFLVKIWNEPRDNEQLLDLFEIKSTEKLPLLLLFSEVDGQYYKIELNLDDSSVDTAYSSIQEQMKFVVEALSQVKEENLKNPEGLYAALSHHYDNRNSFRRIKDGLGLYNYLKSLLS